MCAKQIAKYENPERIKELDPKNTLLRAGFGAGMTLCDIGAGSGVFSFPAAEISGNTVFALEISDAMIAVLKQRVAERDMQNLIVKKVESAALPLEDCACDMAVMVTVLHEIENKKSIVGEIKRILKEKGRLIIIEFHHTETPMGPPVSRRLPEEYVEEICTGSGFIPVERYSMGENFYCHVYAPVYSA